MRRERSPSGNPTGLCGVLEGAGHAVQAPEEGAPETSPCPEAEHGKTTSEDLGRSTRLVEHPGGVSEGESVEEDRDPEGGGSHSASGEEGGEKGEDDAHGSNLGPSARLPPLLDDLCLNTTYV